MKISNEDLIELILLIPDNFINLIRDYDRITVRYVEKYWIGIDSTPHGETVNVLNRDSFYNTDNGAWDSISDFCFVSGFGKRITDDQAMNSRIPISEFIQLMVPVREMMRI